MSNVYQLVNPHIEGEFKNKIKADNSMKAAKQFYRALSEHFNNNVPKFYFTIQKGASGKGKYYHFVAKETKMEDEVKFNIEPHTMSEDSMERFQSRVEEFKSKFAQAGGKKKKTSRKSKKSTSNKFYDDSDLSDSSEEFYRRVQTYRPTVTPPLYYWWYDPLVYNLDSIFIPTFYSYVTPYIEIKI